MNKKALIISLHSKGMSQEEVSKRVGYKHKQTLQQYMKRNNISLNWYQNSGKWKDHSFFDDIDSELKAYLLGFYIADGCVTADGRISFTISKRDIEILRLYNHICPEAKIKEFHNTSFPNRKPQVQLRWSSTHMIHTLSCMNFGRNKTNLEYHLPTIKQKDIIRGYLDGDGWVVDKVVKYGSKVIHRREVGLCSTSLCFITDIKRWLLDHLGIDGNLYPSKTENYIVWKLTYNKKESTLLHDYLYNAKYKLSRKSKLMDTAEVNRRIKALRSP